MIEGLSPPARRAAALGLLVLALLLALELGSALIGGAGESLGALQDARMREARLEGIRNTPEAEPAPPIPPGSAFAAPSHSEAAQAAAEAIAAAAGREEIALESAAAAPQDASNPNLLRIELLASGPEEALLRFIAAVEQGSPAVRLRAWRIERGAGEPVPLRLQATALAAWTEAQQ